MPRVTSRDPIAISPETETWARRAALIAAAASLALFGLRYLAVDAPQGEFVPGDRAFVTIWDPPTTPFETVLDAGDGQAWGALGRDPTFSHPEVFYDGTAEFVYRAQRPLPGWIVWSLSAGQHSLTGAALVAMTCGGMGVLVWASVRMAAAFGRKPRTGAWVGLLPGSVFTVLYLGPDLLLLGLALAGTHTWARASSSRQRVVAIALLTAAVLGRESLAAVPIAIAAHAVVVRRMRPITCIPLAIPVIALGAWILSLHQRYGYWPSDARQVQRVAAPFVGMWEARSAIDGLTVLSVALLLGMLVIGVRRDPRSLPLWCAAALLPVAIVAGSHVWAIEPWRAFLPLYAFALLAALPWDGAERTVDRAEA